MVTVYLFTYIVAIVWWSGANAPWYVNVYLVAINVGALAAFLIDKERAVRGEWRIPEGRLHMLTVAGGVLGSGAGMVLAHHKIRKLSFHAMYFVGVVTLGLIASALAPSNSKAGTAQAQAATPVRSPATTAHKTHPHTRRHAAAQPTF
jgi:uncharacterized membrane protein YsdA (DUF1294 family)